MKRLVWSILGAIMLIAPAYADGDRDHSVHKGLEFKAVLSGAQEVPGNDSRGFALATVKFDAAFTRVFVDVRIHGLTGSFAASHFHCNFAGANGPLGLGLQQPGPLMFDGKSLRGVLKNEHFSGSDNCTAVIGRPVINIASLALAMREGLIYLNVHTDVYPGGEIRGQLLEVDD
jgi:hypothetical protein